MLANAEKLERPPDFVLQSDAVGGMTLADEIPWTRLEHGPQQGREWFAIHCERCCLFDPVPAVEPPGIPVSEFTDMPTVVRLLGHTWRWSRVGECVVFIGQCPDCWSGYWYADEKQLQWL